MIGKIFNLRTNRAAYKYLKLCLLFLLSFILSALIFNRTVPSNSIPPNLAFVSNKYNYFSESKDKYDTLFIGSSRICNQIVPEEFDRVTKSLGQPTSSYNFGIPAMRALPSYFLLKNILSNAPENLKWVFIETDLDSVYEPIENARNNRSIHWHDRQNTLFVIRYILGDDSESLGRKVALIGSHLIPFVYNQINIGRIFNQILPKSVSHPQEEIAKEYINQNHGYYPLDLQAEDPKRNAFLNNISAYDRKIDKLKQAPSSTEKLPSQSKLDLISSIVEEVKAAGANPIFIIPPRIERKPEIANAYEQGYIPTLLSFDDPKVYADLYQIEFKHDLNHLNHQGAKNFSRWLAQDFVASLDI